MTHYRGLILEWTRQGRLRSDGLETAMRIAGVIPTAAQWRRFLDLLALWVGAIFLAASAIFFFAYNWQDMTRFAKFGLIEGLIVIALAFCAYLGLDRLSGKAALFVVTLLTGTLLALVGQTYQTGADTWELFAVWALAILPWVVLGRLGALWLFWIALLNFSITFYWMVFSGFFGFLFSPQDLLWWLFALNTAALCLWELAATRGIAWLNERWSVRVLAVASGCQITALAVWAVFEFQHVGAAAVVVYALWLLVAYAVYRRWRRDVFVLAGGVLSAIVFVTAFLSKLLLTHSDAGGFLFIGLAIIGMSAAGGFWLKNVATEEAR